MADDPQAAARKPISVYRIPIPSDNLRAMPKDERVLLLLLGYVANQISMLLKLVIISTNTKADADIEQLSTGIQTQMLVRLMVGAVNEGWETIGKRFLSNPMQPDYLKRLDAGGLAALDALKKQFGGSNVLNKVRTNFAFHHPNTDDIEAAFEQARGDAKSDEIWTVQFADHEFNSLFVVSDLMFVHGIAKLMGETDPGVAQGKLLKELSDASRNIVEFAKAFFAAAWIKHFGDSIDAKDVVAIDSAPKLGEVTLPFFVEV